MFALAGWADVTDDVYVIYVGWLFNCAKLSIYISLYAYSNLILETDAGFSITGASIRKLVCILRTWSEWKIFKKSRKAARNSEMDLDWY